MVLSLWENGGKIVENAAGDALIECDTCPCGEDCTNCDADTTPGSITATLGAGLNNAGNEGLCVGDCDDFAAAWELPQLTQAQCDVLYISCPIAFTTGGADPVAGCYYGLTEGLPCGCDAIILEILDGGSGSAQGGLTFCWGGIEWVIMTWSITTAGTDDDCLTNIDTAGGGVDLSGLAAGGSGNPCDFVNYIFDETLLDLKANV